ncbi:hypothetical protein ACT9XH_07370 [Methanococcoides methylutens]|uniref:hypothetical protein n=1 Tax=Methanococcoides methylutens TaxID=2226 RepID=UPI0040448B71
MALHPQTLLLLYLMSGTSIPLTVFSRMPSVLLCSILISGAGTYIATLTVDDAEGGTVTVTITVNGTSAPTPSLVYDNLGFEIFANVKYTI